MNLLCLVSSFKRGGAERVIINLLNYLPKLDANLNLFLYFLEDAYDPYPVPPHVQLKENKKNHSFQYTKLLNLPIQALQLKKYIRTHEIDLVLSFLSRPNYVNVLSKMFGSPHEAILNERHTPSQIYGNRNFANMVNRLLIHKLYPKCNKIIAVSKGVKNDLEMNFNIPKKNISVIYNPFDIEKINKDSQVSIDHQWLNDPELINIVSLGRLERPKNQSLLIRAFQTVLIKNKNARLIIIGEGTERSYLAQLIEEFNLGAAISLIGQIDNPYSYLARADLFVLSSNTEGFPNVLVEAMICGCPVISTNCKSGPNEIITHGKNGILVSNGDVKAMSNAIISLIQNNELRNTLIKSAKRKLYDFSLDKIINQYYQILLSKNLD